MGKVGFAIIFAAIAVYAADHRWNDGRYIRSTGAVLRDVQHAIGW
jgi:endo-1,4-beta-D-glucanase Y